MIDFKKVKTDPINHITWDLALIFIPTIVVMLGVGFTLKALKVPQVMISPIVGVGSILMIYVLFKHIVI